jgi:hypothetical protein
MSSVNCDPVSVMLSKAMYWYNTTVKLIEEDKKKKEERIKNRPLTSMDTFFENYFIDSDEYNLCDSGVDDYMLIEKRLQLLEEKTANKLKELKDKFKQIKKQIETYNYVEKDLESYDDYAYSSEEDDESEEESDEEEEDN